MIYYYIKRRVRWLKKVERKNRHVFYAGRQSIRGCCYPAERVARISMYVPGVCPC